MKQLVSLVALGWAFTLPGIADETWDTQIGTVYYADEVDGYAIFSYPTAKPGIEGKAYIKDLAGNYNDRVGTYDGYWVEPEVGASTNACDIEVNDHKGHAYTHWGRLQFVFTEKAFPSGWVALRGNCFEEPSEALIGKPLLGEAAGRAQDELAAQRQAAQ
jgi:hypothetical protein